MEKQLKQHIEHLNRSLKVRRKTAEEARLKGNFAEYQYFKGLAQATEYEIESIKNILMEEA